MQKLQDNNTNRLSSLKETIVFLNLFEPNLSDEMIDFLLGIEPCKTDNLKTLEEKYGREQYIYEPTPYNYIRFFLNTFLPKKGDVVYDLGCGYGRVIIFGALTREAKFKGMEIVPERCDLANKIIKKLGIENAQVKETSVKNYDFSDGNIFFLFNPFSTDTLKAVGGKLQLLSKTKKLRVATWGGTSNDYFLKQNWLKKIKPKNLKPDFKKIDFFISW